MTELIGQMDFSLEEHEEILERIRAYREKHGELCKIQGVDKLASSRDWLARYDKPAGARFDLKDER